MIGAFLYLGIGAYFVGRERPLIVDYTWPNYLLMSLLILLFWPIVAMWDLTLGDNGWK